MVVHLAAGVYQAPEFLFEVDKVLAIIRVIVVRYKNGLTVMTTLNPIMRCKRKSNSG